MARQVLGTCVVVTLFKMAHDRMLLVRRATGRKQHEVTDDWLRVLITVVSETPIGLLISDTDVRSRVGVL